MVFGMEMLAVRSARIVQALDASTHNVANINTPGYKAVSMSFLPDPEGRWEGRIPTMPREYVDFSQGAVTETGNPLDMAVDGDGFFVVSTPDGEAYTRDGRFTVNNDGELTSLEGHPVMSKQGAVVINGNDVSVSAEGALRVDDIEIGKLRIVSFDNPSALTAAGSGLFYDDSGEAGLQEDGDSKVAGRSLEQSNVATIREMVRLIDTHRVFESYQKVMQTVQDMDELSTNRIGRIA